MSFAFKMYDAKLNRSIGRDLSFVKDKGVSFLLNRLSIFPNRHPLTTFL
jgi:hypothetical protein